MLKWPHLNLPEGWEAISRETEKPYWRHLEHFVARERRDSEVFPPVYQVFRALSLTPLEKVSVVILGQDPYHTPKAANGLAFSTSGQKIPPSLRNIYKELESDVGLTVPKHGDLTQWAIQGVLLLNTVLTVRSGEPRSHADVGWEAFTDAVVAAVSASEQHCVFVLWGNDARSKKNLIHRENNSVVESVHPSPLSASRGFFGSKPFSEVNRLLISQDCTPIDWAAISR